MEERKRKKEKGIGLLGASFFFFLFSFFSLQALSAQAQTDLQKQIEQLAKEQAQINQEIQRTQQTLTSINARGATLKQEINRIEAGIRQANLGIQSSQTQIKKLQLEIQLLEADIESQEIAIATRREIAGELMRDLQIKDNENLLMVILKSESLAESITEAKIIEDLNSSLIKQVVQLQALREKLAIELEQLTGKKRSVETEQKSLVVRKAVAEEQRSEQDQLLTQTKNEEQKYQEVLSELEARQQAIANEIEAIETKLRAAQNQDVLPTKGAGVLGWPTATPFLTQGYGRTAFAAQAYKSGFHNGIDLRARPVGQPLYAAADGVILATGDNGRVQYGRYVLIRHNNGLSTLYAHMSQFAAVEGQSVTRGQVIGYSGNTGYSTAPHLHFVVYSSPTVIMQSFPGAGLVPVGSTLNPLDYLPKL